MDSVSTQFASVLEPALAAEPRVHVRTARTFLVLVALGGLTKLAGFLREIVLAALFGASPQMDAFLVAQTLPAVAQRAFEELLGACILPLFAGWFETAGEAAAWMRLKSVLRVFLLAGTGFVLAGVLLARPVVVLLAPGLSLAVKEVAVPAFQVLVPSLVLVVLGAVTTALLNYYHRFVWPAVIALAGNAMTLLAIVFFARAWGIQSAAVGMTLGALVVAAWQWRALPVVARRQQAASRVRPWLEEFSRLAGPLTLGIVLFNLIPMVERFLSSWLPAGGIALLSYAFKVNWLVYIVLVLPVTTLAFPRLASAAAAGDAVRFRNVLLLALKTILLVLLPAIVFLAVAGEPVVRLLYQRGSFLAMDTVATTAILKLYALGLPGASATVILFYALYALKKPAGRISAGFLGLGVASVFGWMAIRLWGARGIAIAHSVNMSLIAIHLGWMLRRSLDRKTWRALGWYAARAMLAAAATFPLAWLALRAAQRAWPGGSIAAQLGWVAACAPATLAAFVSLCWLLRLAEVRQLAGELRDFASGVFDLTSSGLP